MVEFLEKMNFTQNTGKELLSLGLWGHSDERDRALALQSLQSSSEGPAEVYTVVGMHRQQLILVWMERGQEGPSRRFLKHSPGWLSW